MAQPEVPIDEDWEIYLTDASSDEAWEADDFQVKRFYVGRVSFEKIDPITGRTLSLRIFNGRIRMREPPSRFRIPLRTQSPIRWDSFSASSPMESDPSMYSELVEERSVSDSNVVPESKPEEEELPEAEGEEWNEKDTCQDEKNARWFVERVRSRGGSLKGKYVDKAKNWMKSYLELKDED